MPASDLDLNARIIERIDQYLDHDDAAAVLDAAAAALLCRALAQAGWNGLSTPESHTLVQSLGWLRWFRFEALHTRSQDGQTEEEMAFRLFTVLLAVAPGMVPDSQRPLATTLHDAGLARTSAGRDVEFGEMLLRGWRDTGDADTLGVSIALYRRALRMPEDVVDPLAVWGNLTLALHDRYRLTRDRADLDAAIAAAGQALTTKQHRPAEQGTVLQNLGALLELRFEETGDDGDLDESIRAKTAAVDADPQHAGRLTNLSVGYRMRYEMRDDPADLDRAVAFGQAAVDALPNGEATRSVVFSMLCVALAERYDRTHDDRDGAAAVVAGATAVEACLDRDPDRALYLHNYAIALRTRYQHTGDTDVLRRAIEATRRAVAETTGSGPDLAARLATLGSCLLDQYRAGETAENLHEAVTHLRRAAELAPPSGPARDRDRDNLANALRIRYELLGDPADLDAAIALAADDMPVPAGPVRGRLGGTRLLGWGIGLQLRFDRGGDRTDLDAAIEVGRQAVTALTGRSAELQALTALGLGLRKRYALGSGYAVDLDEAIGVAQRALDLTPPGGQLWRTRLHNLAAARFQRYLRDRDPQDLAAADAALTETTAHASDPQLRANGWLLLGAVRNNEPGADLDAALDCWRRAADTLGADATTRIRAALAWAGCATAVGRYAAGAAAGVAAVDALEALTWPGLTRHGQERHLATWESVARDGAAAAIAASDLGGAVELLERGRAVLWAQRIRPRGAAQRLREARPDLASRLDEVRRKLDAASQEL